MKTEQLCKLHMKYLEQLQRSSIGNKSFERSRKQKMLYAKGRVAMGGGTAIASDVQGSREAPLLFCRWRDGNGGEPQFGETNAARQLEILKNEKHLLILWEKANLNAIILLFSYWVFCHLLDTLLSDIEIFSLPSLWMSWLTHFNDSTFLRFLWCIFFMPNRLPNN